LNLLFLTRDFRFLFLDLRFLLFVFAMLLEELVEQHRVHGFVADGFRFAISIRGYKVRVDIGNFFGDQAKRERMRAINLLLIAEADWLKPIEDFAGLFDRLDLFFVATGGSERPDLAI
jgi:hypothetical protein